MRDGSGVYRTSVRRCKDFSEGTAPNASTAGCEALTGPFGSGMEKAGRRPAPGVSIFLKRNPSNRTPLVEQAFWPAAGFESALPPTEPTSFLSATGRLFLTCRLFGTLPRLPPFPSLSGSTNLTITVFAAVRN